MLRPLAIAPIIALAAVSVAGAFTVSQPIDCTLGETCYIQQYVDRDPGPGAQDFTCGPLSYDGHKGTDFALPTLDEMEAGVNVLAAAAGTVAAIRDEMPDILSSAPNAPDIAGRECGNGVLIRHEEGWVTQYCHMKRGSVVVRPGDAVAAGDVLGQVGLSGQTEFPHVHLELRHDDQVVDPFAPAAEAPACGTAPETTIWQSSIYYRPGGLIEIGLASGVPAYDAIKAGLDPVTALPADAPALVVWGFAYGGRAGDRVQMLITGPQGKVSAHEAVLEGNQAQFFRASGRRTPDGGWPTGTYAGLVRLLRGGVEIDTRAIQIQITD